MMLCQLTIPLPHAARRAAGAERGRQFFTKVVKLLEVLLFL
jgi:hypothetical protein